jgi:hypothetical protein
VAPKSVTPGPQLIPRECLPVRLERGVVVDARGEIAEVGGREHLPGGRFEIEDVQREIR